MEISIDPRLREAARTGNISDLYALIQEDPYILERIDKIPFVHTPFHIAAFEGQINFAMEMMNLKPSFARKLNQDGFSPMHLALCNGHTKLVHRLLKTDKDLIRFKGREGMTPLHCVVTMGDSNLLYEFLKACPKCIEDVTVQGETALHLALKGDQIEAFKLLIRWLERSRHSSAFVWERKIVNWRDNDDNTVLHIAARSQQHQVLKLLLDSCCWLDVKAKNSEGLTALEIMQNVQVNQVLNSGENDTKIRNLKKKVKGHERVLVGLARLRSLMSVELINAMLVITALIITVTYQTSLSPAGGVWQGDNTNSNSSTATSNVTRFHFLAHNSYNKSIAKPLFGEESRKAGTTIMNPASYSGFWVLKCITFAFAIFLTGVLLSSVPFFLVLLTPLLLLGSCYFYSMSIISPSTTWSKINLVFTFIFEWLPLFVFLFLLKYKWKKLRQQRDRIKFLEVLGMGDNGISQRLRRTIKVRFGI